MNGYLDKFKQRTTERKQPLRDAIQMSKAMLNSTISLSEAIKKYPQCVDETKIRLVQKQINRIDNIVTPKSLVASIDTLYLSNNSLTSLQGIPQFTNLLHLSLSNNAIKDISTLQELRNMPGLESLNLQGNPVVKHPIYRALVLTALPNLSFHDGRSISKDERVAAEIQVKKQNSLLDLMLVNYIEIQKLNYIAKKLELHEELSRGNSKLLQLHLPNPATAFKRQINLPVMKRVIDLQSSFPDHVKYIMIDNLMADVLTLYHEAIEREFSNPGNGNGNGNGNIAEQCYEKAFSTLLMKQQHLLAALNHENQEKADSMNELQAKLNQNFREQSRHHSPEAAQLRARSSDDEIHYNQGDLYRLKDSQPNPKSQKQPNHQQRSRKTSPPQKLVFKKTTSPRSNTLSPSPDDLETRLDSTNQFTSTRSYKSQQLKKQQQQMLSTAQSAGSPSFSSLKAREIVAECGDTSNPPGRNGKLNRKKAAATTETNNEGCCRRLMNSSDEELEEFKQNQNMKSPYRRTNVQLSREVNELQDTVSTQQMRILELSATLDEQQTLTSQAEKLEYPPQRQQDIPNSIPSNEINLQESQSDNSEQQQQPEELQHRKSSQSNAPSEQKNQQEEITSNDVIPPWITDELQEMRNQINALMSQNLQLQEQSAVKEAEEKNTRDQQENLIQFLSSELQNREANETLAEQFNQLRRKRLVFNALTSAVRIERTITAFKKAHSESSLNLSGYFRAWHRKTLLSSYIVAENRTRIECNLKSHLRKWFSNVRFAQRLRELQCEQAQRRIFTAFVELKSHARLKQQREQKAATAAQFHRKCLILKAYKYLKQQMQKHRISPGEQRRLESIAEKYSDHRVRCKFFDAWKEYLTRHATPLKESLVEFKANRMKRILSRVFRVLQIERINAKEMARRANNYRNFQMKRIKSVLFKKWKAMSAQTKLKKEQLQKYVVLSKLKNVFAIWTAAKKQNHLSKKQTLLAITHARRSLQQKYFKILKQRRSRLISDSINSIKLAQIHAKRRLESSFSLWLARARPAYQATLALREKAKITLQATFVGWKKAIAWKAKKSSNVSRLEEHFREQYLRKSKVVFDRIKKYYLIKRKNRTLLMNFNASRKFKLYRELLLRLAQNQSNDFKVTLESKNRELNATEELAFRAEEDAKELMKTRDEQAEETQRLKEELFQAKLLIEQFQHERVKHNSNVRAIERQERIFQEDRANYERKLAEIEQTMQLMVQEHQETIQEKDAQLERAVQENRSAHKQIASLQNEIQFRQQTLIETERALLHRGDQSTSMIKETEKKLQNSIEMAALFRDKITEQESEIDDLKDSLHSTQIDVEDLKSKLRESISLIKETSEMYDEKILDFTTIIDAKTAQIASLQYANEKKESEIAQLNALNYRPDNTLQHESSSVADFMRTYGRNAPSPIEQEDQQIVYDFKSELQNAESELIEQRKSLDVRMAKLNSNLVNIQNEEKKRQFLGGQSQDNNSSQEQDLPMFKQEQQHQPNYSTNNKNIPTRSPQLLFSESSVSGLSPRSDQKFLQLSERYNKNQQGTLNQHRIPNSYRGVIPQKDQIPSRDRVTSSNSNSSTINPRSQQQFLNDLQKDISIRAAFKDQISRRITQLNSDIDRELATVDNIRSRSRSRSPEIVELSFRSGD